MTVVPRRTYRLVRRPVPVAPPLLPDAVHDRIVAHTDGPLLVVGGPGTGKTTTLAEAVTARVVAGTDPERILVLTFGRRAAQTLRERIEARVAGLADREVVHQPTVRTFHAYAYSLLRRAAAERGEPSPRLLTGPEQDLVIRELLEIVGDPDPAPAQPPAPPRRLLADSAAPGAEDRVHRIPVQAPSAEDDDEHDAEIRGDAHRAESDAGAHGAEPDAVAHRAESDAGAHGAESDAVAHRTESEAVAHRAESDVVAHRAETDAGAHSTGDGMRAVGAGPGRHGHDPAGRGDGRRRTGVRSAGHEEPEPVAGPSDDDPYGWPTGLRPALRTRAFATQLRDLMLRAVERGVGPADLTRLGERLGRDDWPAAARFLREYAAVLALRDTTGRSAAAYDAAELVRAAMTLLLDDPGLLESERRRISHVYVDELADTDPAQIALLDLVAGGGKPLVAFADPDSSVYGFRGADPAIVTTFPARFRTASGAPAATVTRTISYRAAPDLLAAVRRVARRLRGPIAHRNLTPPTVTDAAVAAAGDAEAGTGAGRTVEAASADTAIAHGRPDPDVDGLRPSVPAGSSNVMPSRSARTTGDGDAVGRAGDADAVEGDAAAVADDGASVAAPATGRGPDAATPTGADEIGPDGGAAVAGGNPGRVDGGLPHSSSEPANDEDADAMAPSESGASESGAPGTGGVETVSAESGAPGTGGVETVSAGTGAPGTDGVEGLGADTGAAETDGAGTDGAEGNGDKADGAEVASGEEETAALRVRTFRSAVAESAYVAHALREAHLLHDVPWSRMAVIVRSTLLQLPPLQRALHGAGVPTVTYAEDLPLHLQPAVAPLLLLLRCALEPDALDEAAAVTLLHSPLGGADPLAERRLRQGLRALALERKDRRSAGELIVAVLHDPAPLADVDRRWARPARTVAALLETVRTAAADPRNTVEDVLWALWRATGLGDRWYAAGVRGTPPRAGETGHVEQARADAADRDLDAVLVLFDAAARFADRLPGARTEVFLDHVLGQDLPADSIAPSADRGDAVRLLTAHAAKGLEWDVVAIAGVQEGVWPDLRLRGSLLGSERLVDLLSGRTAPEAAALAGQTSALLDEERRLFYVAASRARTQLLVTAVESASVGGADGEEQPSRFLHEIGSADDVPPDDFDLQGGRLPRALTLAALVAELRTALTDPRASAHRRRAAAGELARLAAAGVPGAHPDEWWGLRPLSDDRPLIDDGAPVRVTPSTMEGALRCSLRWLLERHGGNQPAGPAQGIGNLVHAAAMLAEDANADRERLIEYVAGRFPMIELAARWLAGPEQTRAEGMVDKLLRWLAANPRRLLAIEHEFAVRLDDGTRRPIDLVGRVDRLEIDDAGRLVVVDLKTGRSTAVTTADVAEHPQLAGYQAAVEAGGFADFGAEPGGAALVQLGTDTKAAREQSQAALADSPDPGWAGELVRRTAETMAASTFSAVVNKKCRTCPVQTACPVSGRGRQVVEPPKRRS
ncbi:UvrD-helicase domain-containing protein [Catenuloplanes japonicus]|uniref:UvrD-helicase domain-containing protein n=1 Tax=Catenuloplanes japonicus TaxID=33876 RepID=UPI000A1025AC|nr:UvrD-helicase domain-containing protein [Catenuloplanes japonicus]